LLLSNSESFAFDWKEFEYFDPLTVSSKAIAIATTARALALARFNDQATVEDAYAAGLFHDIGQILLARVLGKFYDSVVESSIVRRQPLVVVEREMIGSTHAQVGAYVLGLWGFPGSILDAVSLHHSDGLGDRVEDWLVDCVGGARCMQ
jgi:HD-like signal output (HDOD) protein